MRLVVTLMTEWRDGPLWISRDGDVADSYQIDEVTEMFLLDDALLRDIADWDERFQATYRPDDPVRSGFASEHDLEEFLSHGRKLARRLRAELESSVSIEYAGDGSIGPERIDASEYLPTPDEQEFLSRAKRQETPPEEQRQFPRPGRFSGEPLGADGDGRIRTRRSE